MKKAIIISVAVLFGGLGSLLLASFAVQAGTKTVLVQNDETMKTIHLTKTDFFKKVADLENNPKEWKYLGDKPAVIDFYADWCGPCKRVAPILEELAGEYAGRVYIYKVNVDQERELAGMFGIRSIPTLLFIPMEGDPKSALGAMSKADLKARIEEIL